MTNARDWLIEEMKEEKHNYSLFFVGEPIRFDVDKWFEHELYDEPAHKGSRDLLATQRKGIVDEEVIKKWVFEEWLEHKKVILRPGELTGGLL
jgi:hypothetical protein